MHTLTRTHVRALTCATLTRTHTRAHVHTCTHSHLHTRTRAQIPHVRLLPCILRNEPGQTSRAAACLPSPRHAHAALSAPLPAALSAQPGGRGRPALRGCPGRGPPVLRPRLHPGFGPLRGCCAFPRIAPGPHSTALFARDAFPRGSRARATPRLLLLSTCLVARVREKEGKIRLEGAHVCAYTPHLLGRLTLTVRGRPRPARTEEELGRETAAENLAEEGEPRPLGRPARCPGRGDAVTTAFQSL